MEKKKERKKEKARAGVSKLFPVTGHRPHSSLALRSLYFLSQLFNSAIVA